MCTHKMSLILLIKHTSHDVGPLKCSCQNEFQLNFLNVEFINRMFMLALASIVSVLGHTYKLFVNARVHALNEHEL